jgi:hypothetical protein
MLGPTHTAGNKLDLLMCNSPEIVGDVSVFHPETCGFPTDHYIVEFEVKLKFKRAKPIKRPPPPPTFTENDEFSEIVT